MEGNQYTKTQPRGSYKVGSCMSLAEAKREVKDIKQRYGYTEIAEIRAGERVQFYHIAIKLKVDERCT